MRHVTSLTSAVIACSIAASLLTVTSRMTAGLDDKPVVRLIARGTSARIEAVDWGGRGPALVFLPGLGNTAHVFQDFAARFTDRYRVVAITPRGFGASTPTDRGAPLDTILADVAAVLDTLRLRAVTVIGHSLGGDVATFFAVRYPNRVARIIYLDGANDRRPGSQPRPLGTWPAPPALTASDSASAIAYQAYVERNFGPRIPRPDIEATFRFDSAGRIRASVTTSRVTSVLLSSMGPAPFDSVHVPALALFPRPDPGRYDLPYWNGLTGSARINADSIQAWFVSSTRSNMDSVHRMMPQLEVVEIPRSGHLLFLLTPSKTEVAIRHFLARTDAAEPPRRSQRAGTG